MFAFGALREQPEQARTMFKHLFSLLWKSKVKAICPTFSIIITL
jgi:hypothetical protein